MTIFSYLDKQLTEFIELDMSAKVCLVGSWVAASGAALLLGASACTVTFWLTGNEPNLMTKKTLAVGFAGVVGGAMFTTGAALESDRQTELESDLLTQRLEKRRAAREASPCPNCKYFSNHCDLYCSVNPLIACTPEANNCKDFEPKEIN